MDFRRELDALGKDDLLRELKYFTPIDAVRLSYQGRTVYNFSSNDYLGLSKDPRVIAAAEEEIKKSGVGTGASRLISGTLTVHQTLEERLAAFKQKEKAVVFPTGYMANVGIITALFDKKDCLIIDKLSHASIIDACTMSGATVRVFPHRNYKRLGEILAQSESYRKRCIITDSVFSMDGDCADLRTLVALKKEHKTLLMIDEAHATGVFGTYGRGLAEEQAVEDEIDISMGTLSKALGCLGGFVVGKKDLIDYLHNKARSFIYTTGFSGHICAAVIAAIDVVENDITLRQKLWNSVKITNEFLHDSFKIEACSQSPIIPIVVGETKKALALSQAMLDRGFYIPAVRYPTVAKNKARLRLSLSAAHDIDTVMGMLEILKEEYDKHV